MRRLLPLICLVFLAACTPAGQLQALTGANPATPVTQIILETEASAPAVSAKALIGAAAIIQHRLDLIGADAEASASDSLLDRTGSVRYRPLVCRRLLSCAVPYNPSAKFVGR